MFEQSPATFTTFWSNSAYMLSLPAFAGRLLVIHQISRCLGKENQSPGFSVKPKQIFFLLFSELGLIGFYFRLTRVCFFWINRKWSIPVNTSSDWPFFANNSMAKRRSNWPCASSAKKKKYAAKYKPEWATDFQFICHSDKGPTFAYCRVCNMHINIACLMTTLSVIAHSNADSERVLDVSKDQH